MTTTKSVSFRSNLNSNVTDLIQEIEWHCTRTSRLITGIVSKLAAYTEEGVSLTPSVFICNSISELLQRAGMGEYVPLSSELQLNDTTASSILKSAAPLCHNTWRIYIERCNNGENFKFGVFCGRTDPSSLTVDEVILESFESGFPIVKISQNATNKVEVRTNSGNRVEFRFNDDLDVFELSGQAHIKNLAESISTDVAAHTQTFSEFLERLLTSSIGNSHGTLIAVIPSDLENIPDYLQDAVKLNQPIDLFERFKLHIDEGKTAASVSRLQSSAELVSGFLCSDGITIFNSKGKILGYRAFLRYNLQDPHPTGGARARAFDAMCLLLENNLSAVFFKSQDGQTKYMKSKETKND